MRQLSCSPDVRLLGYYVSAFADNLQGDETRPIMEKFGLVDLQPTQLYPCHQWMDALNEMAENPNFTSNFIAIGMQIGQIIPVPPDNPNPDFVTMLNLWDHAYQVAHPTGGAGKIEVKEISEKHYTTTHTDLYPDDFMYGILYAQAKRFLPPKTPFKVYYDTEVTPRDAGGVGPTVIHVDWS